MRRSTRSYVRWLPAGLARDRRSVVAGRLYRLQLPDLARLDRFEGCPAASTVL
jgi:hypothetical protein